MTDGWNGLWQVNDPWVPHRGWWDQIRFLRTDVRQDVEVRWVPGHSPLKVRGATGNLGRRGFIAAGNSGHEVALQRTREFASRLRRYYTRLLDLALEQGRLPEADLLGQAFPLPRPPALPAHTMVVDRGGVERCFRCGFGPDAAKGRQCADRPVP